MYKFKKEFENPIDIILSEMTLKTLPFFYNIGFTPNYLTTISLITGLLTSYLFYKKYFILSSLCFLISYCFDIMDGMFARKYKMTSKFGDYYDHFSDIIKSIILTLIFIKYNTLSNKMFNISMIITILLFFMMLLFFGCQEKLMKSKDNLLTSLNNLCINNLENKINILKYMGNGTIILWICILILLN